MGANLIFITRCITWIKTWADRQKNQENDIPALALRKHQSSARQDTARQDVKEEQLKVKKVVTKLGSDTKNPALPEAPKSQKPKVNIGQVAFLTVTQFDAIPKYMKGRVTYEGVNAAVEELNVALMEKYTFLGGRMADLPNPKAKKRYFSQFNSGEVDLVDILIKCSLNFSQGIKH